MITVNGGDFKASTTCFQSNGGELYITGGTFNAYNEEYNGIYTINFIDEKDKVGKIEISGGDFFNFNPYASKSENPVANFVKTGSTVKVLKEDGTYASNYQKAYTETQAFGNRQNLVYQALYIILCKSRIRDSEMSLVFSLLLIL